MSRLRSIALGLALPAVMTSVGVVANEPTESDRDSAAREELPIGLYITPWRTALPELGADKPVRLMELRPELVDPVEFRRELEYRGVGKPENSGQ